MWSGNMYSHDMYMHMYSHDMYMHMYSHDMYMHMYSHVHLCVNSSYSARPRQHSPSMVSRLHTEVYYVCTCTNYMHIKLLSA